MAFPETLPFPFGGDIEEGGVVDHAATAVARLAEFIKTQPNFLAILAAGTTEVQSLETAFQELNLLRSLPAAVDGQLDVIGSILTQPRNGQSDTVYRTYLAARIILNHSSGTIPQVVEIFTLIAGGYVCQLTERFPASFDLQMLGPITIDAAAAYLTIMRQARGAGIGGAFRWTLWPEADTFTLDGTPAQSLDAGHLTGIAL